MNNNNKIKAKTLAWLGMTTILTIIILFLLVDIEKIVHHEKKTLTVLTWRFDIPKSIHSYFEKNLDIKINEIRAGSGSNLLEIIENKNSLFSLRNRIDVVITKDTVAPLLKQDKLHRLDYSKLRLVEGLKKYYRYFQDPYFEYLIPFSMVQYGYLMDKRKIDKIPESWKQVFENYSFKKNIVSDISPLIVSKLVALYLGNTDYCRNVTYFFSIDKIINAIRWEVIVDISLAKILIDRPEIILIDSTKGITVSRINSDYIFIKPKEGTLVYHTSVGIVKHTLQYELANTFISEFTSKRVLHLLRYESSINPIVHSNHNYESMPFLGAGQKLANLEEGIGIEQYFQPNFLEHKCPENFDAEYRSSWDKIRIKAEDNY